MYVSHLVLKNWRNFLSVDVPLQERMFIMGPNASGKSNLLDVFRFLRDIAQAGGGLQKAVSERGGLSRIRCLAARKYPNVEIDVTLRGNGEGGSEWRYAIGIRQQTRGDRLPLLAYERVWNGKSMILERPDADDEKDELRLTQTHLEQINANVGFREISTFLNAVCYLHLVPQLVRHPREFSGPGIGGDPFGREFLERIARTPTKTREARLRAIQKALTKAVPFLKELSHTVDAGEGGVPHLEAVYEHWRPNGAKQRERDFSDGTLRLIGLLWSLLDGDSLLLLEEPELSLNAAIVREIPGLIHRARKKRKRQVLISSHSAEIFADKGIGAEEVLLLTPQSEGTRVQVAAQVEDVRAMLDAGLSIGDAALSRTRPKDVNQLLLWPT